jgi:hypothetical protein
MIEGLSVSQLAYNGLGLGEELVFEIRPARTAAKFIIKSSLLFLLPNLYCRDDY